MNTPTFSAREHSCKCQWTGFVKPPGPLDWTISKKDQLCMTERLPVWYNFHEQDEDFAPWPNGNYMALDDAAFTPKIKDYLKRPANASHGVVWLIGDSHAARLAKGMEAATWKMPVVLMQSNMCALMTSPDKYSKVIMPIINSALKENLREGDIVAVIYASWRVYNNKTLGASFEARLRALQPIVHERGAKLVLFGDWHEIPHPGPNCYGTDIMDCTVNKAKWLKMRVEYDKILQRISALPSVHFMNFMDLLCPGDHCNEILPGTNTLGFKDRDHINDAATYYLAPFICHFLSGIHESKSK